MDPFSLRDFETEEEGEFFNVVEEKGTEAHHSSFQLLRTSDYNLNSPLIEEKTKLLKEWITKKERPKRMEGSGRFEAEIKLLSEQCHTRDPVLLKYGDDSIRAMIGRLKSTCQDPNKESDDDFDALAEWMDEASGIKEITDNFLRIRGIEESAIKSYPGPSLFKNISGENALDRTLRSYYHFYLAFHEIVLMMNSLDIEEEDKLIHVFKRLKCEKRKAIKPREFASLFVHRTSRLGKIFITKDFCLWKEEYALFDKNMILMMKDIFLSRFNSVCVILIENGSYYSQELMTGLIELYKEGDNIVSLMGSSSFDAIKLLEPIVINNLVQLAEEHRPLIPHLGDFGEFIANKIQETIEERGSAVRRWFTLLGQRRTKEDLVFLFGCYRHWGHPFIDYRAGLHKLFQQVHMEKEIDEDFGEILASDLSFKLMKWGFEKFSRWFIDEDRLPHMSPLKKYIEENNWPPQHVISAMGDTWHLLPITTLFETPESLDPSETLDDKSHSFKRSELKSWITVHPYRSVPSKKVVVTALASPPINPREVLRSIDQNGLEKNSLIIGLKAKERELKRDGRFFALMSWDLRLYFVITEKLLADHVLPLFDSLTMTDNLNKVFKKLIDRVNGQGLKDYSRVTWAFHLDYEKWNNHQRYESTKSVFEVLDKFFGYENLYKRTHEMFQESWIYYPDRPDLIKIEGDDISTKIDDVGLPVHWNGQDGGLEGLRQKGWSLISLLMIEREAKVRNTQTKILAQGDNQVLCPTYSLSSGLSEEDLKDELNKISKNASSIFEAVKEGARKLGLIIKGEETMCSYDFLIYGKTPLFRGNVIPQESKRWARVSCLSNDQVINLSNIMSTVSTNALTVAQHSNGIIRPIQCFLVMSLQAIYHYALFSPLVKRQIKEFLIGEDRLRVLSRIIFLDPSLGGVSGTSLGRFHLRQFPDPVTEGLSFWKETFLHTSSNWIKKLSLESGRPEISPMTVKDFSKLIEDPSSLNIKGGISPSLILRDIIRTALYKEAHTIVNEEFKQAIILSKQHNESFLMFLMSVKPRFPRFLSEFYMSTFLGISESVIGLIQNSRTIRKQFKSNFNKEIGIKFRQSEENAIRRISVKRVFPQRIWSCSAEHADLMRELSWGGKIVGTTVPHPSEMLKLTTVSSCDCQCSRNLGVDSSYISITVLPSFDESSSSRGPLKGYLGSSTSSSTQIFHSWEKVTNIHVVKRALAMRESINWFISEESNLSKVIKGNIKSLLALNAPLLEISEFQRTGSALHRFHSGRYRDGGFSSINPNRLSHISVSSDTMSPMSSNGENYDFMFQTLMLYSQTWVSEIEALKDEPGNDTYHHHLSCKSCVREIEDCYLESDREYPFPDVAQKISSMTPGVSFETVKYPELKFKEGDFSILNSLEKSFMIGQAQGLLFGIMVIIHENNLYDPSLFPVNIFKRLAPKEYLRGVQMGIYIGASLGFLTRLNRMPRLNPRELYNGVVLYITEKLKSHPSLYVMLRTPDFYSLATSVNHRVPSSYPLSMKEGNDLIINLLTILFKSTRKTLRDELSREDLWLFSDFRTPKISHLAGIAWQTFKIIREITKQTDKKMVERLKFFNMIMRGVLIDDSYYEDEEKGFLLKAILQKGILWVRSELRHSARDLPEKGPQDDTDKARRLIDGKEPWVPSLEEVKLLFVPSDDVSLTKVQQEKYGKQIIDPLVSGLRVIQLATGAHYKLRAILSILFPSPRGALVVGDGSGGISRLILCMFGNCRVLFNSLLNLTDDQAPGTNPLPPSALMDLNHSEKIRILQYGNEWSRPSDLRHSKTWSQFSLICRDEGVDLDLIVCDAEVTDIKSINEIASQMLSYLKRNACEGTRVIFKSYLSMLTKPDYQAINILSSLFDDVSAYTTSVSSSFTSEVYILFQNMVPQKNRMWLSEASLHLVANIAKSTKSREEEFKRACSLKFEYLICGFPFEVSPDPIKEIIITLLRSGFDSNLIERVETNLIVAKGISEKLSTLVCILLLNSNRILNTTKTINVGWFSPPSDPELRSHFNSTLGICEFICWCCMRDDLHEKIHFLLNHSMKYNFSVLCLKENKHLAWSWYRGSNYSKIVKKNSETSFAAHWIRCCFRYTKGQSAGFTTVDNSHLMSILKSFNELITLKAMRDRTSLLEILP